MPESDLSYVQEIKLLTGWNLPDPLEIHPVDRGVSSRNFSVQTGDGGRYFLKEYSQTSAEEIKRIHRIESFFNSSGLPVPLPLVAADGSILVTEPVFASLYPFVQGEHADRESMQAETSELLALTLAKLHRAGTGADLGAGSIYDEDHLHPSTFEANAGAVEAVLAQIVNPSGFDLAAREVLEIKRRLVRRSARYPELPADTLIHGDYSLGNVLFAEDGSVAAVVDWEAARMAPRAYELFMAAEAICLQGVFEEGRLRAAQRFLNVYRKEYSMGDQELAAGIDLRFRREALDTWIEVAHYRAGSTRPDHLLMEKLSYLRTLDTKWDWLVERLASAPA